MTECIEVVSHSKVKVEEYKRKAIFLNEDRKDYEIGRIDGCLVKSGIKADFYVSSPDKTVLVELKGTNIDHACKQLFAAAENAEVKKRLREKIGFLVICSRVPSATTSTQIAAQRARKKYNAKFQVFCNQRELRIENC